MPEVLSGVGGLVRSNHISPEQMQKYARKRAENIARSRGVSEPSMSDRELTEEFACDAFGAVMYVRQTGDDSIYGAIGFSPDMVTACEHAIMESLAADNIPDQEIEGEYAANAAAAGDDETKFSLYDVNPQNPTYEQLICKPDVSVVRLKAPAKHDGNRELSEIYSNAGYLDRPHTNKDTGEKIFIPQNFMRKFLSNPGILKFSQLEVLPQILEEMVFVGKTPTRLTDNSKSGLEGVYAFFGAVSDGNRVIPVKLTVKAINGRKIRLPQNIANYIAKENGESRINKLYDSRVLELESIENLGATDVADEGQVPQSVYVTPRFSISVEELLNMVVGPARKYIPAPTDIDIVSEDKENVNTDFSTNEIPAKKRVSAKEREDNLSKALDLFQAGKTVGDYYAENPQAYNHQVARQLRGIHIRDGNAAGGALPSGVLQEITKSCNSWKQPHPAALSMTQPIRVFENLGNWRTGDLPSDIAMNYRDGERMVDTYWYFGLEQNMHKNLWMREEQGKVYAAFGKADDFVSALSQMIGEKYLTPEGARKAVADRRTMIVPVVDGVMVFDQHGQLKLIADSKTYAVFDKVYRKRMREANKVIAEIIASNL